MDYDLADFTVCNGIAVRVNDVDVKLRRCLTHSADLRSRAVKVCDCKGGLGLTEAFHNLKSGGVLELLEYFRIECFTGGGHVMNRRKVEL